MTGRPRAQHPTRQVQRIEDLRAATKHRNETARCLDDADRDLLAAVDRAQRSGITYEVLIGEVPGDVARTASTLRRKVAEHRRSLSPAESRR